MAWLSQTVSSPLALNFPLHEDLACTPFWCKGMASNASMVRVFTYAGCNPPFP
jgi:hypothetical protein